MKQKRDTFDIVWRFGASGKILLSQGMWLTGRLCGQWLVLAIPDVQSLSKAGENQPDGLERALHELKYRC